MLFGGVHAVDQGEADLDLPAVRAEGFQVFQNQPIVHPGVRQVGQGIYQLDVVEEGVRIGEHSPDMLVGDAAAGVDVHAVAQIVEAPGQLFYVVHVLGQGLAAGEGDAAAGALVEHPVLLQ